MNVTIVAIFVAQTVLTIAGMYRAVQHERRLDVIGTPSLVAAFAWGGVYLYATRYSTVGEVQPFAGYVAAVAIFISIGAYVGAEKIGDRRKQQYGSTPTQSG